MRFPKNSIFYKDIKTMWIKFSARDSDGNILGSVLLPMPMNVSIADSATYGTIALGAIGGAAIQEAQRFMNESQNQNIGSKQAWENLKNRTSEAELGLYALQSGIFGIPESISSKISFLSKTVVNPNTNTIFQSTGIRNFDFSFSLIPTNKADSDEITKIVKFFRKYLYPEKNEQNFLLKFPPIWNIKFVYGNGAQVGENSDATDKLPKIHECFLTSFSSSYNSEGNSFHRDGSPFDVSCSLTFTETKPNSRETVLGE